MSLKEIETKAKSLMTMHGVGHVKFEFDGGKRRLGCMHRTRINGVWLPVKITLSRHYAAILPMEEIEDVILHEIAHALVPGHGHDAVWRATARRIGAKGDRCATPSARPPHNIEGWCPLCDCKVSEHLRMPRAAYIHRACRTRLTYRRL